MKGRSRWRETLVLLGDGKRSLVAGEKLERVNPAEVGAFYEREMPRLVLFVTLGTGLDIHAAADVAQVAFEKALSRWPTLRNPRAWLYRGQPLRGNVIKHGLQYIWSEADIVWLPPTARNLARLTVLGLTSQGYTALEGAGDGPPVMSHPVNYGQWLASGRPGRRDMTRMYRWPAGLAVLVAAAVGLAACSGGSSSPQVASLGTSSDTSGSGGASAQPTGKPAKLLDEWAACIRKHGDPNQADPTIDSNKDIEITMASVPQALQKAIHDSTGPCSNYLLAAGKDLRGGQSAPTVNPAQDVKFAACMRASGFPKWPDPVNGNTNFGAAGIDPNSQAAQSASKACDSKLGIRYYAPGTEMPGVVIVSSGCTSSAGAVPSAGASRLSVGSGGSGSCANG